MKRVLSLCIALALLFPLVSCGPKTGAEAIPMERYQAYALGTVGTNTFYSFDHIDRVAVFVPEDLEALLEAEAGALSHLDLEDAEALVLDFTGETFRAYVVSGENTVLHAYGCTQEAAEAPMAAPNGGGERSLSQLRQEYAQLSVNLDNFDKRYAGEGAIPFPAEAAALAQELGDACFLDPRYLALEAGDKTLAQRTKDYLEPLYLASLYLEAAQAGDFDPAAVEDQYYRDLADRDVARNLLEAQTKVAAFEGAAQAVLAQNAPLVEAIKADTKEADYRMDSRYVQLMVANNDLAEYTINSWAKADLEALAALVAEVRSQPEEVSDLRLSHFNAQTEQRALEFDCRVVWAKALTAQEDYRKAHQAELTAYDTAVTAIADSYGGKGYEEDIDYLKLNIVNDALLKAMAEKDAAVTQALADLDAAIAQGKTLETDQAAQLENLLLSLAKTQESALLDAYLKALGEELLLDEAGAPKGGEAAPEGWMEMPGEFVTQMDEGRKVKVTATGGSSGGYSGGYSSGGSGSGQSFEDYLKENDPDSYEFYQGLEDGWNSGTWDSEDGFYQPGSGSSSSSSQSFEDYLKENDPDSYEFYQGLEKGWDSGTWDAENGFYQP